jgi:hypothetical protein
MEKGEKFPKSVKKLKKQWGKGKGSCNTGSNFKLKKIKNLFNPKPEVETNKITRLLIIIYFQSFVLTLSVAKMQLKRLQFLI